ncbi:MAG: SUMF1/EgtB/PvdO family nonheme iron enzyme [Candidatus Polarisedimenticolaceae bacterium]|nr:SUMF1/EgtB/PvdO family nonheme iron enzyme [Candidatus Polarisedimenticolaceae bacterium]
MTSTPKERELKMLSRLTPLNMLSDKVLAQLLQEVAVEYMNRGEYLFHEGDTLPENIYLLSGKVSLLKGEAEVETLTGNTDTTRFAIAHQLPRQHTARAKSRIEFVRINSHRLSKLIEHARANAYKVEGTEDRDWKSLLLQSQIFQHIPRANIRHVMSRMEEVAVRKDEEIIQQGEEGDYFYFISEGRCVISQKPVDSYQSTEVARLGPGDCFGEDALLSDNLRSSTVSMLSDGVLMRLSKDDFINLIKHPLATTVNFSDACQITIANGIWLDIRSPVEYQQGHMSGSINLPLNSLRFQVSSLAPGHQYVIYCQDGRYSAIAAFLLLERGFDAVILSGGIKSIPDDRLICRETSPQEKGAKIITLRPGDHAGIAQHEQASQKLAAEIESLEQRAKQAEESNAALQQQINRLRSGKREQELELEVLLSTAQEQERLETAELQTVHNQIKRLQQQLAAVKKERNAALRQLKKQSRQSRVADTSSLLCSPDLAEIERATQLQAGLDYECTQTTEQLQERGKILQNRLEQQASTMDPVDQEAIRQELDQLHNAIKERGSEMERALLEQRSLEDALEDRDAHLEQVKQEMEQLKVKLESATARYEQADEAHRHAEEMVERLKGQLKKSKSRGIVNTVTEHGAGGDGRQIKTGLFGMLMGGLICFFVLNVLLVLNGKDEIIFSLTGERVVQEMLSSWLVSEERDLKSSKPLDVKKSLPDVAVEKPEREQMVAPAVVPKPVKLREPKVIHDQLQDGSAGPAMAEIPAGRFLMGSNHNALKQDERPLHRVELRRYYAARYETTFEEYDRFAQATGRRLPDDQGWGRGRRPVINVSWEDALAYTAWLSEQTGASYRLPTEAEWEYAAGAGNNSLYWWGYKLEENRANCYNCGVKWAGERTAPVGSFKANPFGLHNTAGNVMEWIQDCYSPNYVGAPTDGSAWTTSLCKQRVVRGGAYSKSGMSMRTTERNRQPPSSRLSTLGFRVVRE